MGMTLSTSSWSVGNCTAGCLANFGNLGGFKGAVPEIAEAFESGAGLGLPEKLELADMGTIMEITTSKIVPHAPPR